MKIGKVTSLKVADKVLAQVKRIIADWPKHPYGQADLRAWSNCREQGYHLIILNTAVVWAECRNSNEIIVVSGSNLDFDITTNMPSDKIWNTNAHYFNSVLAAAEHIAAIISNDVEQFSKR